MTVRMNEVDGSGMIESPIYQTALLKKKLEAARTGGCLNNEAIQYLADQLRVLEGKIRKLQEGAENGNG